MAKSIKHFCSSKNFLHEEIKNNQLIEFDFWKNKVLEKY